MILKISDYSFRVCWASYHKESLALLNLLHYTALWWRSWCLRPRGMSLLLWHNSHAILSLYNLPSSWVPQTSSSKKISILFSSLIYKCFYYCLMFCVYNFVFTVSFSFPTCLVLINLLCCFPSFWLPLCASHPNMLHLCV